MKLTDIASASIMAQTEIVLVTPEIAAKFLESNKLNRKLSQHTLEKYAHAMKVGEWMVNGETIKLDTSGNILDGQHRLQAIIKSGVPVYLEIRKGLSADSFKTIDTGKVRSGADVLSIKGEKSVYVLASSARNYLILTGSSKSQITNSEIIDIVEKVPQLRYWSNMLNSAKRVRAFMPSSFAAVMTIFSMRHGSEAVEKFLHQLDTGANLSANSPALVLRERFSNRYGVTINQDVALAYMVKALNAFVTGKKIGVLRYKAGEEFPKIV